MAEIRIERRSPVPIWALVIGLIAGAMVIVWVIAIATRGPELANPRQPYATRAGRAGVAPVSAILAAPGSWAGHPVSLTGIVSHINSPGSFWLSGDGSRILVVVEYGAGQTQALTEGQRLQVEGDVHRPAEAPTLSGVQALDAETVQVLRTQPAFVYARAANIQPFSGVQDE